MYYDIQAIGQRLQKLRENQKETQETLSEQLNISLSMLKKIETGRKRTSVDILVAFAEHFNTTLDYIILGRSNSSSNLKLKLRLAIESLEEIEKKL